MKRSEMIVKMRDHWLGQFEQYEKDLEDDVKKNMGKLLEMMEYFGMLPPFNSEEYHKTWRDGGDGHKWEKE